MSLYTGGDILAHLEAEAVECQADVVKNVNLSADWHRARLSGLLHAVDLIRRERGMPDYELPRLPDPRHDQGGRQL